MYYYARLSLLLWIYYYANRTIIILLLLLSIYVFPLLGLILILTPNDLNPHTNIIILTPNA